MLIDHSKIFLKLTFRALALYQREHSHTDNPQFLYLLWKGLTLETTALETPYCGQFTLSSQLIKLNYLLTFPFDAAPENWKIGNSKWLHSISHHPGWWVQPQVTNSQQESPLQQWWWSWVTKLGNPYRVKKEQRFVKVGIFLSVLNSRRLNHVTSAFELDAWRGDIGQLKLLHVSNAPA